MPRSPKIYLELTNCRTTGAEVMAAVHEWADDVGATPALRKKYLSVVRRSLERLTGSQGDAMLRAIVGTRLRDLPVYASRIGRRSASSDYRSAAALVLELLTGHMRDTVHITARAADTVSSELAPLMEVAPTRHARAALARLERVMFVAGVKLSERMDREKLIATGAEMNMKSTKKDLSWWRTCRAALVKNDPTAASRFGVIPEGKHPTAIGLRCLPEQRLRALLAAAGYHGEPEDLSPFEQVKYLSPNQYEQVKTYMEEGRTRQSEKRPSLDVAPATAQAAEKTICTLVGLWCRYGDPSLLRTSDLRSYFTLMMPDRHGVTRGAKRNAFDVNASAAINTTCPLIQYLADESLEDRLPGSRYQKAFEAEKNRPRYMPTMRGDLVTLWTVVRAGFTGMLSSEDMALLSLRFSAVLETMEQHMAKATANLTAKDKALAIKTVNYEQVLLLILPGLLREERAAERAYISAVAEVLRVKGDPERDNDARRLKRAWRDASFRYLALAVPAADLKRDKQYRNGTLGAAGNFQPEWGDGGSLDTAVCRWTRDQSCHASLKGRHAGEEKPEVREEVLNPLIVDYRALDSWIREHRVDLLVKAREFAHRDEYDLDADMQSGRFALFPSPHRKSQSPVRARTDFSAHMGQALYYGCRKFLGRKLPDWDARTDDGYTAIFSDHIMRLFGASAIFGQYRLPSVASALTDDTETTLKKDYLAVSGTLDTRLRRKGKWDRTRGLEDLFWRIFAYDRDGRIRDELVPFDPLAELLARDDEEPGVWLPAPLRAILVKEREDALPVRRRDKRKAGPHKRTKRSDQAPPLPRRAA